MGDNKLTRAAITPKKAMITTDQGVYISLGNLLLLYFNIIFPTANIAITQRKAVVYTPPNVSTFSILVR